MAPTVSLWNRKRVFHECEVTSELTAWLAFKAVSELVDDGSLGSTNERLLPAESCTTVHVNSNRSGESWMSSE